VTGSYGGATQTIPLLPGSSAIEAGNAAYCTAGSDQRGVSYIGTCDFGAFESGGFNLEITGGNHAAQPINSSMAPAPEVTVTSKTDPAEPVNNGVVTFSGPASGAGISPQTSTVTIASGKASLAARTITTTSTTSPVD
jgi:hypothetical protein